MLDSLITTIDKAINQTLTLDPQKERLIQNLNQETLALNITDWNLRIILTPKNNHITITQDTNTAVNAELTADLLSFIRVCFSDMPQMFFYSKEIKLKGSLKTVLAWQRFYTAFSPELSYWLEPYLGKTLTYHLSRPLYWFKRSFSQLKQKSSLDLSEYLTEELMLLIPKEAVNDLNHDILLASIDTDRLQNKLSRLKGS